MKDKPTSWIESHTTKPPESTYEKLQRANEKLLENLKPWKDECLKLRKEIKIYEKVGQQNIELIGQNFELKKELDREHRTVHDLTEQIDGWAKRQRELLVELDKCQAKLNDN